MRNSEIILGVINLQSKKSIISDLYRKLYNTNLYYDAYNELSNWDDSLDKFKPHIDNIILSLKNNSYKWAKRESFNRKFKTASLEIMKDLVLQKVIYKLLYAIYSNDFVKDTFGYMQDDTHLERALSRTLQLSQGIEFFIRYDLSNLKHIQMYNVIDILRAQLNINIHDNRFIELILSLLKTGFMSMSWESGKTFSGTDLGTELSELLFTIIAIPIDKFIKEEIVHKFTINKYRDRDKTYRKYEREIRKETLKQNVDWKRVLILKKERNSKCAYSKALIKNTEYRRCGYIRYADQCILPFTGTYSDAVTVKNSIKTFIYDKYSVVIDICISHVRKDPPVRFLNHDIIIQYSKHRRSVNGNPVYLIPKELVLKFKSRYMKQGYSRERPELTCMKVFDIVSQYQRIYTNIVQYYVYVRNKTELNSLQWVMEESLSKTLAQKLKISVSKVYKKYRSKLVKNGHTYPVIECNENGYKCYFGGIPLKKCNYSTISDYIINIFDTRGSFIDRLSNRVCSLCGSTENVQMHHINSLKNINKNYPIWLKMKMSMTRKTIPVCKKCHDRIHSGTFN